MPFHGNFVFKFQHEEEQEKLRQELRDLQNELTVVGREREQFQLKNGELQMEQDLMRNAVSSVELCCFVYKFATLL